jgi:hypothetical protein
MISSKCEKNVRRRVHHIIPSKWRRSKHSIKKDTLTITTSKPPVLLGCKSNQEKLWMVSANQNDQISEEANNVYSLPSIPQTITYLHAAAGFPVKVTWMDAIKAGNFTTWPSLTTSVEQYP